MNSWSLPFPTHTLCLWVQKHMIPTHQSPVNRFERSRTQGVSSLCSAFLLSIMTMFSFFISLSFITLVIAQFASNNETVVHREFAIVSFRVLPQFSDDGRLWDVVIETCDKDGAGTDAAAYLKIFYESGHDSETFHLDNPGRNDFEQGSRDHFKIFFKQSDIVNMGLFWWPGFSLSQSWCVNWVC